MLSRVIKRNRPTAAVAPTPQANDPWKPHRQRHWRILYRGKDKKPHFHGQQPDESVTLVVRKHKWFLVRPALPFIGAIVVFLLVSAGAIRLPSLGILWGLLEGAAIILMIATGAWFAWRDLVVWWYDVDIITNKRLITWRGFLNPSRKETELEKIQLVALDQKTFGELFLRYGNLHLYVVGGEIVMNQVPRPKRVREAIEGLTDDIKATKKPDPPPPVPLDPVMAEVLTKLGKPKDIPKPPDPDAKYPPLRDGRRIGPRRLFGRPLFRIVCDVRYSWGESTVMYIQHSWFVLLQRMFLPVFALLILLPLTVYIPYNSFLAHSLNLWWFILGLLIVGLLVYLVIVYINWVDDVYILTNRRIIDIERKLMFLYEARVDVEYKVIRDIKVTLPNLLLNLLDIGNVEVETPGTSENLVFKMVRHPLFIQDKINELKGLKEKVDKIKGENDRKKELQTWFGTVLTTLEQERPQETTSKGAPNLQGMDLFTAMEKAGEVGLEVVVFGEEPTHTHVGQVMYQSPPHGTLVEAGGELQVWLGRRPTPADII